jgi:hypothetical protein
MDRRGNERGEGAVFAVAWATPEEVKHWLAGYSIPTVL